MDDSKELISYMVAEINSIVPLTKEATITYVQDDDDNEEALFTLDPISFQSRIETAVKYIRGVRDAFKFMNDYELENLSKKGK